MGELIHIISDSMLEGPCGKCSAPLAFKSFCPIASCVLIAGVIPEVLTKKANREPAIFSPYPNPVKPGQKSPFEIISAKQVSNIHPDCPNHFKLVDGKIVIAE